tara:strand:+ start:630 stop:959 length:330 start_codon:yes stop_codon:yes gene_type:complete
VNKEERVHVFDGRTNTIHAANGHAGVFVYVLNRGNECIFFVRFAAHVRIHERRSPRHAPAANVPPSKQVTPQTADRRCRPVPSGNAGFKRFPREDGVNDFQRKFIHHHF